VYRGKRIAVVVPAHNESDRVGSVLETVPAFVDRIILVDDASTDGTGTRVQEASAGRVEIVRRQVNGGVGAAIVSGYRRALASGADLVAVMAGDGQMDPAELHRLLDPLVAGRADYAKGDRLSHPDVFHLMPFVRLFGNALLTLATRLATGLTLVDSQCGYTAITREALARLPLDQLYPRYGFPNDLLMKAAAARLRVVDVPVRPIYHPGPGASGIVLRSFIPRVGWLLLAGIVRRFLGREAGVGWGKGEPGFRRSGETRPRILVLTSSYPRWRDDHAGHFVAALARRWAARAAVTVLAPWDGLAPREERGSAAGLTVRRFRYAPRARWHRVAYGAGIEINLAKHAARIWLAPFLLVFCARALIEARRHDVLVSNWLVPAGAVGALCRALLGKRHLTVAHGGGFSVLAGRGPHRLKRRLLGALLRRTDRVVCVSAALRDDLLTSAASAGLRLRSQNVPVIPMGVETERFFAAPPAIRGRSVLFLGRLIPVKAVECLIEAMARVPDATLSVAGEGPLENVLRDGAAVMGERVRFLGAIHGADKAEALSRAAVLVLPSVELSDGRTEGVPAAILEGMAAGCAVVASDVGGIGEVVRDGWNGFLVKPGDPEKLAERIRWLLDRPRLREAIGRRAMESARAYDADTISARLYAEIDRVAPRPSP
jgi:glycosyltransferase involved in cell wall biosynthesis